MKFVQSQAFQPQFPNAYLLSVSAREFAVGPIVSLESSLCSLNSDVVNTWCWNRRKSQSAYPRSLCPIQVPV